MFFAVIISVALAQTSGKVEIIKGGMKKKRAAVTAPADNAQVEALAAREKALADKAKELDAKNKELDAKSQQLDAKSSELDVKASQAAQQREDDQRRANEQKKAAEKLSHDNNAVMRQATDALGGN